jgi:hypothetical protein
MCNWARAKTESNSQAELLENQRSRIQRHAAQMQQVGKEAVGELRQVVKSRVMDVIRKPIKKACDKFVEAEEHRGVGAKTRILIMFHELANQATKAAEAPATKILEENFTKVRSDIKKAFDDWGDPLEEMANLVLQRHAEEMNKKSDEERESVLNKISALLEKQPLAGPHKRALADA